MASTGNVTNRRTASHMDQQYTEHLYKILVIGEFGVGKTAIIRRYTEGYFTPNYKLTIGVDFALKEIHWDDTTKVNLQLWDIAGHERFGQMTRVYYKYAIAAILVFDLTRPSTFEAALKWFNDVNDKVVLSNEQPIPIILLANKCDLENKTDLNSEKLDKFCKTHKLKKWFWTSAKTDENINEAMDFLVGSILTLTAKQKAVSTIELRQEFSDEGYQSPLHVNKKADSCGC